LEYSNALDSMKPDGEAGQVEDGGGPAATDSARDLPADFGPGLADVPVDAPTTDSAEDARDVAGEQPGVAIDGAEADVPVGVALSPMARDGLQTSLTSRF
jgi:hypothetical protein